MYIIGFINTSNKGVFVLSFITSVALLVCGVLFLVNYPKKLSPTATFEGVLIGLNKTEYSITVKGVWNYGAYSGYIQEIYDITQEDLPNISRYANNYESDSVIVRIWAKKNQARQIEMNGTIVKRYDWWKYAKPALWLMILPGSIFLILLILDRKRLLKEPESKK